MRQASGWGLMARTIATGAIAWGLWLPLHDVLAYPDRISVLPNLQTDAATYHAIAADLANSGSVSALPIRHPPGWVSLLALIYHFTGPSYVGGKLVSWLALVLTVAICAWLARRTFDARAGWIAALVCAWSPALRGYVGTLQYEVLTGALLMVVIALGMRTVSAETRQRWYRGALLTGVAGGALIITRETFVVIVPIVAAWMAHQLRPRATIGTAAGTAAIVVGVAMAPAVIWSGLQSYRAGSLVTISEKGPLVLELGYNPRANGTYNAPLVGIGQPTGLAFVRAFPARTIVLAGRKVLYFWGVLRDGWNVPRPSAVWAWRATTGLIPLDVFTSIARGGWLLALFIVSLVMFGRDGLRRWWVLPGVVLMLLAVHAGSLSSHRFAVPILPVVFVLVSGPLAAAATSLAAALRAPAVAGAAALLAVVVVAMQYQSWPLQLRLQAADLDGLEADNVVDAVSGRASRLADARRGVRPVALLPDEFLPAGALQTEVALRRASPDQTATGAGARVALVELDGRVACARDVSAGELPADRFETIAVACRISQDTAATLAIFSLGTVDLAVDSVRLRWTGR